MTKRDLYFCLRCGVVVVGKQGHDSAVGRVTLVNWENQVVFDRFVKVPLQVADYCTESTGITKKDLTSPMALTFDQARTQVATLIKGKILIGHGLEVDLSALGLAHPLSDVRDTATYAPYMAEVSDSATGTTVKLPRELASLVRSNFDRDVVGCPIQEAIACLDLYKLARKEWESELIKMAQLKDRQLELVMSMRSGQRDSSRMSVPLSAIREDEKVAGGLGALGSHRNATQPYALDESTLSSTAPTTFINSQSVSYLEDDISSQASSFVSVDTDMSSSVVSRTNRGRQSEIENLEFLNPQTCWSATTSTDCSVPGSWQASEPSERSGLPSRPTSPPTSGMWGTNWSSTPVGWSQSGNSSVQPEERRSVASQQVRVAESLSEDEELRQHLPSQLLADLDAGTETGGGPTTAPTHHPAQLLDLPQQQEWLAHDNNKKQSSTWFRSLRGRQRSTSVGSSESNQNDISTEPARTKESGVRSLFRRMHMPTQPNEVVNPSDNDHSETWLQDVIDA